MGGDDSDDSVFEMYKNLKSSFSNAGRLKHAKVGVQLCSFTRNN